MSKGGGAWKVAYADFVTVMMAFFMVMWICGQDQKMKTSIARYFNNPLGLSPIGGSTVPDTRGSLFDSQNNGQVPRVNGVELGMGRSSHSRDSEPSPETKVLSDYMFSDEKSLTDWQDVARKELSRARTEFYDAPAKVERTTIRRLSEKMRSEVLNGMPADMPHVYRDLLFRTLNDVNWNELAEDVVENGFNDK